MSRNSNKHVIVTTSIIKSSVACTISDSKKEQDYSKNMRCNLCYYCHTSTLWLLQFEGMQWHNR